MNVGGQIIVKSRANLIALVSSGMPECSQELGLQKQPDYCFFLISKFAMVCLLFSPQEATSKLCQHHFWVFEWVSLPVEKSHADPCDRRKTKWFDRSRMWSKPVVMVNEVKPYSRQSKACTQKLDKTVKAFKCRWHSLVFPLCNFSHISRLDEWVKVFPTQVIFIWLLCVFS